MILADKLPPHNLEAERAAIGSVLYEPAVFDDLAVVLEPSDFWRAAHADLWRALADLARAGHPLEPIPLLDRVSTGDRDRERWEAVLDDCLKAAPHAANGRHYAGIVRELATLRRLAEAAGKILETCYGPRDRPLVEIVAEAEGLVMGASREFGERESDDVSVVLYECLAQAENRSQGLPSGLPTGFVDFDRLMDGFKAGQLIVLAARPGQGKSSFALDVAAHAAFDLRKSVVFSSLEMGRHELGNRLLSSKAKVPGASIASGRNISDAHWESMGRLQDSATRARFLVDDAAARSVSELASLCRRRAARGGLDLIVVDYLQLVRHEAGKGANRQEQVAKVSRDLKCLAKSLSVPVLALSQLNREVEKRDDQKPRLSDLRESGAIEQDADIVLFLHPGDGYAPTELIVAKNRSGPTGIIKLNYRRDFTTFENWSPLDAPAGAGDYDAA